MTTMSTPEDRIAPYVRAALALHGYRLDAAQTAAVVEQFSRIAAIAETFLDDAGPAAGEPLPVLRP